MIKAIVSYLHCMDKKEKSAGTSDLPETTAFHFGTMSLSLYLKYGKGIVVIPSPDYTAAINNLPYPPEVDFSIYPPNTVISMVQE